MKHAVALALVAGLFATLSPIAAQAREAGPQGVRAVPVGSGKRPVTIRFSYYADVPWAEDRPESEVSCSLRLPRGSDGVGVLRAAVDQDCIQSFGTRVRKGGRVMLQCINYVCSGGTVPAAWDANWTGERGEYWQSDYWRFGLQGFSASAGDSFTAYVQAVI